MPKRKPLHFVNRFNAKQCLLLSSPFWLAAVASQGLHAANYNATDLASLRTAITNANNDTTDDTITVAAGTYTLTGAALEDANASGDLDITKSQGNLEIVGAGAGSTIIDGNQLDRVFHINAGGTITVTIRDLTIQNGKATDDGTTAGEGRGGGILLEQGDLTLNGVVLDSNSAVGQDGTTGTVGASAYAPGSSTQAQAGNGGAGTSGQAGRGGGVFIGGGTVQISDSTLSGNSAVGGKGGTGGVGGHASASWSATGGTGGAGGAGGNGEGGAVYVGGGSLSLTASTISGGSATGGAGGDGGAGGNAGGVANLNTYLSDSAGNGGTAGDGGNALGAGVLMGAGTLNLVNSTLSGASATPGDGGTGGAGGDATGVTASGPVHRNGGDGGDGGTPGSSGGGGLYVTAGTVAISNCTVANHSANVGNVGSGGAAGSGSYSGAPSPGSSGAANSTPPAGGGMYVNAGTVTVDSSIFAGNSATNGADVQGNLTAGASLFQVAPNGTVTPGTGTNITGSDPVLSSLANNGGPTMTHAIDAASPARNVGSNPLSLGTDQRGLARDDGNGVDMGAFEYGAGAAATTPPTVTDPSSATYTGSMSYDVKGTAVADSLVKIYSDANNDGIINGADAVVASVQLTGGATNFSITVNLTANGANDFTATDDDGTNGESGPVNVPTITQDSMAPNAPTVTDPTAGGVNTTGTSYTIVGTAETDSTVIIYSDFNNNGIVDGADAMVASGTATGGNFSIGTPITQSTTNNFTATAVDAAGNESNPTDVPTITETTAAAISPPTVTDPSGTITIDANSYDIKGTAQADALVRIYSDLNNDGFINGSDAMVGSMQLTGGATDWTVNVPLTQSATNSFLATAEDGMANESLPANVPDITEQTGGSSSGGGGGGGGGSCTTAPGNSSWLVFGGLLAAMLGLMRNVFRRRES